MRAPQVPRHAAPACGVPWCADPGCGVAAALDQSAGRLALSMLGSQLRQARAERLASTPRRVGTRFGVLLVVACFALNGADAVPAALAAIEAGAGSLSFAA